MLDATTFADFVGVVEFSSIAKTYVGLTTLARAMPDFKATLSGFIDEFYANGGTYMADGFERAFKLVDDSKAKNYEAGCHTTYVLVTDGEWSGTDQDPTTAITTRQSTHTDEHFFVVGLGDGVSLQVEGAASQGDGDAVAGIRFFADGSASGGRVTVTAESGQRHVMVHWLTGTVEIVE